LLCMSRGGAPEGGAVVLDVAQLEALLTRTFSIGLDVGRGREKVALVRLRLSRALLGAAETQAMAAEALVIERGVATEHIAAAEGLALHAAAFNGTPDPVLHLAARAMGVATGLAALEPDPRAPGADVLLDAALQAATGLQQLLAFRPMTAPPSPPRRAGRRHRRTHQRRCRTRQGRRSPARAHRAGQDDRTVRPHRQDGSQLSPARQRPTGPRAPQFDLRTGYSGLEQQRNGQWR
jgi:hypothetical protein